jgi:hypothetical protein
LGSGIFLQLLEHGKLHQLRRATAVVEGIKRRV